MTWLERYRREDPSRVYRELVALGDGVRDPAVLPGALAVAREAAARIAIDVALLSERWQDLGFEFGYEWAGAWAAEEVLRAPPHLGEVGPDDLAALDRFEAEVGPLPLALRAFHERVGAVNFVGEPCEPESGWPDQESLDPLQVEAFTPQLERLLASGGERALVVCPDFLHKFFLSGVGSLSVPVPAAGFDAVITFEGEPFYWNDEPLLFLEYLREVILRRGGIGLMDDPPRDLIRQLVPGLVAF